MSPKRKIDKASRQKAEINPLLIRSHDNSLTAIMKLIRQEFQRKDGSLPTADEDLLFYTHNEGELDAVGAMLPKVVPMMYGTGIVLHFNEEDTITPIVHAEPRPQLAMHGMGFSFPTPVYNWGDGQDRYVTPHEQEETITYTGTGTDDLSIAVRGSDVAGNEYNIDIAAGDPANPNTFNYNIYNPRSGLSIHNLFPVAITGGWQTLTDDEGGDIDVMFGATTGHDVGDVWQFTAVGTRTERMGGETTVFRVNSDDDYTQLNYTHMLATFPTGKMTVWLQGFDSGADGNRKYYILDIAHRFLLYYEYSAPTDVLPEVSKLVWIPNVDKDFRLELDIPSTGIEGWFGFVPTKFTLIWDYAAQIFEMYYGHSRAAAEPTEHIPMPEVMGHPMALGNSLRSPYYDGGGDENAYQHFDEWTFTKLVPGLLEVSSIDGYIAQTLLPIHEGDYMTACGESVTPIDLGSLLTPFDRIYVRYVHTLCGFEGVTPEGGDSEKSTYVVSYTQASPFDPDFVLIMRPWQDENLGPLDLAKQVDYPRRLQVTCQNNDFMSNMTGTVTIDGIDADGAAIQEIITVNVPVGAPVIYLTDYAFARVSAITTDKTDLHLGDQYEMGVTVDWGVPNYPLALAGDVFKATIDGVDTGFGVINPVLGTVALADVFLAIADVVIFYRSVL